MNFCVLLTGLVRNEAHFKNFINAWKLLESQDKFPIYYSTWINEIDHYPKLRIFLEEANVFIIEQEEPNLILNGHTLHQIAALDAGLIHIDSSAFVLKSRPDFITIEIYKMCFSKPFELVNSDTSLLNFNKYKYKVLAHIPNQPFYINDLAFAGKCSDLKNLCNWPILSTYKYVGLSAEQMIWGGAFVNQLTILDQYFRVGPGLYFNNYDISKKISSIQKNNNLYINTIALYLKILISNFQDMNSFNHINSISYFSELTIDDIFYSKLNDSVYSMYNHSAYVNSMSTIKYLEYFFDNSCRSSDFGTTIKEGLFNLMAYNDTQNAKNLLMESYQFGEQFSKEKITSHKAFKALPLSSVSMGPTPAWRIKT